MTEEEAFVRIEEIGQAFANDVNDGDSEVLYEGLQIEDGNVLVYEAVMEDHTTVKWRWVLIPLSYDENSEVEDSAG